MAIGIYWRSGVVHHTLAILLCSTDVDVVRILVVSICSGDRSSTVRHHHYVRGVGYILGHRHRLIRTCRRVVCCSRIHGRWVAREVVGSTGQ
jgi:hypothetical protein